MDEKIGRPNQYLRQIKIPRRGIFSGHGHDTRYDWAYEATDGHGYSANGGW